jgi:hypothetical protein
MPRKSVFLKKLMGERSRNSDGFGYSYGRFKGGFRGCLSKASVRRMIRADKRAVRAAELRDALNG